MTVEVMNNSPIPVKLSMIHKKIQQKKTSKLVNIFWLKSSGKIGEKSITKNSENFNESTIFFTKLSLKLVKIGWIHQNLHEFCRKSSWAPIWKIVMNWSKKNGKDYQHLKTKIVKCCQNFFIFFHNHLTFSKNVKTVQNFQHWPNMSKLSKIKNLGECPSLSTSKHLKGHSAPRVSNVTFFNQRDIPGSLSVT